MQLFLFVCVILWVIALVSLCNRRDIEVHTKITWIVTVLVLNALGAIIYLLFGPKPETTGNNVPPVSPDATPVNPEGESWNPFTGQNSMGEGKGLNPPKDATAES